MSWGDVMEPGVPLTAPSPVESARFGRPIERLTVSASSATPLEAVCEAVARSAADVVILRYPAEHVGWFAALTTLGRTAVLADSLVYWRLRTGTGRRPAPAPGLAVAGVPDPAEVRAFVGLTFAAYGNHYLANPLFDPADAAEGYAEWALRSAARDGCVTLRDADGVLALATTEEDGPRTEILLAGVTPAAQGRGVYAHLLAAVEDRAAARGAAEVVISTQGHNTRVQRAWARYGFEPVHTLLTVHLIRGPLPR
ncbi:N-acetyltransferase [Microbispora sp. H11081]|uniref:GNAT family N-acetyltransferase n=1 Tax=Microbispora sp. H11081 TaxID=2729107 RepID=UPI0014764766|nr:GNAT family N-acetyltransferase [Microbispora sp. H11081]